VVLVLAKLSANPDPEALLADYPHLSISDVRACLAYAAKLAHAQGQAKKCAAKGSSRINFPVWCEWPGRDAKQGVA
jgi:hypothetical protein